MANHLTEETSPYLLQHVDNPVDWYPWGDEAMALAKAQDRPILLSIGYAACHWCHVMAHESFEDDATATQMNADFVNVKVDREERPDIDSIYMQAVTSMIGRGGWPMTVFLTPDGKPFYAGTYFPKEPRHGMPSFRQILTAIKQAWDDDRENVVNRAGERRARTRKRHRRSSAGRHAGAGRQLRRHLGRLRRCAQISATDDAGIPSEAAPARSEL
jgi:uncharacterized protein